ncbi:MAG: RNA polymerase sporulation sigma factor SigK [bacterium]|nr:RNA polymerase sporulation sigma factor SigK [bacterium]
MLFLTLFTEWINAALLLTGYVSSGGAFPKSLTREEEDKYIDLYINHNDEKAKNILIERNLRLVAHIAKKYSDDRNSEDIISIGTIGLIKGINTYRPEKAKKLSSYISRCAENEILMYLRATKKLGSEVSIDESIGTDREGNSMTLADILTSEDEEISDQIMRKLDTRRLYSAMIRVLSPDEEKIMLWRYGLGGTKKRTQQEIADELGISRSYVSRIEKRCVQKLAKELGAN